VDKMSYERVKEMWSTERGVGDGTVGIRDVVERVVKLCLEGDGLEMEVPEGSNGTTVDMNTESAGPSIVKINSESSSSEKTSTSTITTFLVIDALNELPSQSQSDILRLLGYLTQIPSLRIIVTSQLTDELANAFKKWSQLELQVILPCPISLRHYCNSLASHVTTTIGEYFGLIVFSVILRSFWTYF